MKIVPTIKQFTNRLNILALMGVLGIGLLLMPASVAPAFAQSFNITGIEIKGNERIEDATILSHLGIEVPQALSAAQLNDAFQRLQRSALFDTVDLEPKGNRLVVTVKEYPTINRVTIEGNERLKDDDLLALLESESRKVYNPTTAEADAATLAGVYRQAGRIAATVTPRIIPRSKNRVDLVFEVTEGRVIEVERISFVGNRAYSDRRLRRVIESKQAGLFRQVVGSDTYIADRIAFDQQLLRDFYLSRGYVDFRILSTTPELTRQRDAFFITFKVQEGQQFKFGNITATSNLSVIDPAEYHAVSKIKSGKIYTPTALDTTVSRMERLANQKGLNFIRVEPRVVRVDEDLTLYIEFAITRGPRIFVERIDIKGNSTTLDKVIRRQFRTIEGDPFNPREIRDASARIRALNFFSMADVSTREGSAFDQVIVEVDLEETTTGSLGFGVSYASEGGPGFNINFAERNFLGRGQGLSFAFDTGSDTQSTGLRFSEPALLGRDLAFGFAIYYRTTDSKFSLYNTRQVGLEPSIEFPTSDDGRFVLSYRVSKDTINNVPGDTSPIITKDEGGYYTSALGYGFSHDTRRSGLDPTAGVLFQFNQQFGGLGGDRKFVNTRALVSAERRVAREDVLLRAELEGGLQSQLNGNSRISERFFLGPRLLRGFSSDGIGPRDRKTSDALGGNRFIVARLESEFPIGLPDEYGISGGAFFDIGSVWGLDDVIGGGDTAANKIVDDSMNLRAAIGVAILWTTQIGPLRFNFSRPLMKEITDRPRNFDLTVSSQF